MIKASMTFFLLIVMAVTAFPQVIKLDGTIVGHDTWSYFPTFDPERWQIFFVRIDRLLSGKGKSHYVKVVYRYTEDPDKLPSNLFTVESRLRFKMSRDKQCDGPIHSEESQPGAERKHPVIRRVPGMTEEPIPIGKILPCYRIRKSEFPVVAK